jgi:hypothetical protein
MDLTGYDPRKIPRTAALFDQKKLGFDDTTRWWFSLLLEGEPWKRAISTEHVHSEVAAMSSNPYSKRAIETAVGVQLRKLCPAITKERHRERASKHRVMYYQFPELKKCREAFEKAIQQRVNWETGDAAAD